MKKKDWKYFDSLFADVHNIREKLELMEERGLDLQRNHKMLQDDILELRTLSAKQIRKAVRVNNDPEDCDVFYHVLVEDMMSLLDNIIAKHCTR